MFFISYIRITHNNDIQSTQFLVFGYTHKMCHIVFSLLHRLSLSFLHSLLILSALYTPCIGIFLLPNIFFLLNEYFWNNSKGNDLIMCREFLSFSIIFLLQVCMDHQRRWSNLEVLSDLSHKVMTRGREKEKRWNTFCNNIAFFITVSSTLQIRTH